MFLIAGVLQKCKELGSFAGPICPGCGAMGRYLVQKEYSYFHLFFLPLFSFSPRYSARTTCCGMVFPLSRETGRALERGELHALSASDLGNCEGPQRCAQCGAPFDRPDYLFCPRCGAPRR